MTTLDQAFIKAFTQQSPLPPALAPQPAAPAQKTEGRKQRAEPQPFDIGSPQSPICSPPAADGVWAALEQPSKAPVCLLKTEENPDTRQPAVQHSAFSIQPSLPPIPCPPTPDVSLSAFPPPPSLTVLPPAHRELKPVWQVDHFTWPRLCRRLIARAADELDRLADSLLATGREGHKVLAIAGCRRGEGATTLLLCAARRLAERGIKPVLVDADLARPRLAKRLGVQSQLGWDETTEDEGRTLDQAVVEATANNLALLPVREPPSECGRPEGDPSQLPACLGVLRNHYDMVLVDLGPLEDAGLTNGGRNRAVASMIDAVVLVHNPHITSEQQRRTMEEQLTAAGIAVAGIVENFVAE